MPESSTSDYDEKTKLGDLNQRLEAYIINEKQKETSCDTFQKDLDQVKDSIRLQFEQAKSKLKEEHERKLAELRAKRENTASPNIIQQKLIYRLKAENSRQSTELSNAKNLEIKKKKKIDDFEEEIKKLLELLTKQQEKTSEYKSSSEKLGQELKIEEENKAMLTEKLMKTQKKFEKDSTELMTIRLKCKAFEEDIQLEELKHQSKAEQYKIQISNLTAQCDLTKIKLDHKKRLKEVEKRCIKEKDELRNQLTNGYIKQLNEKKARIEALQLQLNEIKYHNQQLNNSKQQQPTKSEINLDLEKQKERLEKEIRGKQKQIDELQILGENIKEQMKKEENKAIEIEAKFKSLHNMKANIKSAIATYDAILKSEEQYSKGEPCSKRHKKGVYSSSTSSVSTNSFSSISKSSNIPDENMISSKNDELSTPDESMLDPVVGEITFDSLEDEIIVSIILKSFMPKPVQLQSWSLRSKQTGAVFNFPPGSILSSDQEIKISSGSTNSEEKHDYKWNKYVYCSSGDEIGLYDGSSEKAIWSSAYRVEE